MTYAIAIVNKNPVNRTVSFENELVPLNGHIPHPMHRTYKRLALMHWTDQDIVLCLLRLATGQINALLVKRC